MKESHYQLNPTTHKKNFQQSCFLIAICNIIALLVINLGFCQDSAIENFTDGRFTIVSPSKITEKFLPEVFTILQTAQNDIKQVWNLNLPEQITIIIHPTLTSFQEATKMPWYIAGIANKQTNQIHLQRLKVLKERHILKTTLRHELFHLAQKNSWSRWLAEGLAISFAGDKLNTSPLTSISEAELNNLLANPQSQHSLQKARATAFVWSRSYLPSK